MATVCFENIVKRYGQMTVIHGVSTNIKDGEFVVLVGPSGCGKSTLLRMLAGLEEISDGTISISDRVVNEIAPKDRDIAMVFQNYALYPHMTVRQNMAFAMRLARVPTRTQTEKIEAAADILGLGKLLERYPAQLSGGQRQRVAMGRAIVRNPKVFLFDEPLSNLDAKLRVQMRAEIKALHQKLRTTTIYVTHDQIEAMTMADRIVIMREGKIEQVGVPLDLYDRPINLFVAGFIGSPSMNLIEGRLEGNVFRSESELSVQGIKALGESPSTGDVVLGIRPNKLTLSDTGCPAEVVLVEPTGDETQVLVRVGSLSLTLITQDRVLLRPGDRTYISMSADHVHIFDRKTEQRISI